MNGPNFEGIEGNIPGLGKSININGPSIDGKILEIEGKKKDIIENSLKGLCSGDINDDIKLNIKKRKIEKEIPIESISGSIKGIPLINYFIEYGSSKGFERPKIKKGKDFYHNPEVIIKGKIEGKKNIPPTLRTMFGGDINGNINLNNNLMQLPQYKIEEDISGFIEGNPSGNIDINMPNMPNIPNMPNMPNIDIKGSNLKSSKISGINGELIERIVVLMPSRCIF